MKSLILYYSYTGNCRKQAMKLHEENPEADIYEVKEKRRKGKFTTFMIDCPKAALRKKAAIQDITIDLNAYDRISVFAPIWNSYPAPHFNAIVEKLPSNKEVELYMCSGGGETKKSKQGTCDLITKAGCTLLDYHDVQTVGMVRLEKSEF